MRMATILTAALADPAADGDALEACVADTWPGDVMAACGGLTARRAVGIYARLHIEG